MHGQDGQKGKGSRRIDGRKWEGVSWVLTKNILWLQCAWDWNYKQKNCSIYTKSDIKTVIIDEISENLSYLNIFFVDLIFKTILIEFKRIYFKN